MWRARPMHDLIKGLKNVKLQKLQVPAKLWRCGLKEQFAPDVRN